MSTNNQAEQSTKRVSARRSYRHGDLRQALLEVGIAMAREGGPDAVVLREATRRIGVAPNAAYRHFANHQALLEAVRAAALAELARAIQAELAVAERVREPKRRARAALRGVGLGYLRFARSEPGLFRTAFAARPFDVNERDASDGAARGTGGMDPFELLGHALDQMAEADLISPTQRRGAEWIAWSAVHGMAMLMLDGPLRGIDDETCAALAERLVRTIDRGLVAGIRAGRRSRSTATAAPRSQPKQTVPIVTGQRAR